MLLGMMLAISCLQGFQLPVNTMCRALLWDFVSNKCQHHSGGRGMGKGEREKSGIRGTVNS